MRQGSWKQNLCPFFAVLLHWGGNNLLIQRRSSFVALFLGLRKLPVWLTVVHDIKISVFQFYLTFLSCLYSKWIHVCRQEESSLPFLASSSRYILSHSYRVLIPGRDKPNSIGDTWTILFIYWDFICRKERDGRRLKCKKMSCSRTWFTLYGCG